MTIDCYMLTTTNEILSATYLQLRHGEDTDLAQLFEAAGIDVDEGVKIEGWLHGSTANVTTRQTDLHGVVYQESLDGLMLMPNETSADAPLSDLLDPFLPDDVDCCK